MNYSALPCGPWTGFYNYEAGGHKHRMDLSLMFVQGIVSGQGGDRVGIFGIAGCYEADEDEILWTKTYFGAHRVRYCGFVEGRAIWGTWEIEGGAKGGFHIWPRGEMIEHELDEPAVWPVNKPSLREIQR